MDDLEINDEVTIPHWELWFTASGAGGAGGQHVNTSDTRVTLQWKLQDSVAIDDRQKSRLRSRLGNRINNDGVLQISAQDERSQRQNLKLARERMAEMVAEALKPRKRRKRTRPPRWAKRRRLKNKRHRSEIKDKRQNPDPSDWS